MGIKIIIPNDLQDKINGQVETEAKGHNIGECIGSLVCRFPGLQGEILDGQGKLLLKWMIYVNNQVTISSTALTQPVKEGDIISLLPLIAGG